MSQASIKHVYDRKKKEIVVKKWNKINKIMAIKKSLQMYKYYQNTANSSVPESGPAKITVIMKNKIKKTNNKNK